MVGPPLGAWIMYGSSEAGLYDAEAMEKQMSILTLSDSTYSLNYVEPGVLSFVESGKVEYDVRTRYAKFTVVSASGVDWSGDEPRKLVDVPDVVPWQRDPGVEYVLEWGVRSARFHVDGEPILACETSPREPLGFVMWIDNQYMVVTPWGKFRYGWLEAPGQQWMEVDTLSIEPCR